MAIEWNKMTVNQLKSELTKRGLEKTGPKSELVKRLKEAEVKEEQENVKVEGTVECVFSCSLI